MLILQKEFKKNELVYVCLITIFGIGKKYSLYLCSKLGLNKNTRIKCINRTFIIYLIRMVSKDIFLNIELKRHLRENIKIKINLKSYQGIRHLMGLPVNGQNTKNNRKTARKLLKYK